MFKDNVLMITGGTGSFGNAVLDRFLSTDVREIRIFSRDEKKQEEMRLALNDDKLKFYIGDVRDYDSIHQAMKGVDYVFHAAALKQVPSCEFYPLEAVRTNIIGAENVMSAAIANDVRRVVVLSTDKAVYPINAMGLSKAMMEKLMLAKARLQNNGGTILCDARAEELVRDGERVCGVVARIDECTRDWCRLSAGGYRGWAEKKHIWGVRPDEVLAPELSRVHSDLVSRLVDDPLQQRQGIGIVRLFESHRRAIRLRIPAEQREVEAIADLEVAPDGSVWVAQNSEIYNYSALRQELEARGHRFATHSDTDVIANLYEEHGLDFTELRGDNFVADSLLDAFNIDIPHKPHGRVTEAIPGTRITPNSSHFDPPSLKSSGLTVWSTTAVNSKSFGSVLLFWSSTVTGAPGATSTASNPVTIR